MWGKTIQVRRWNKTAADCYKLGCDCQKCPIYETYFKGKPYKCQMKIAVFEMVRKFGTPDSLIRKDEENLL